MPQFGCFYHPADSQLQTSYLPQVGLDVHATIVSTTCRTVLTQTFTNPSTSPISEVHYTFPLYDRTSIVGFTCSVGDNVIKGEVKPKAQAEQDYQEAKSQGRTAAIFDHSPECRDIFKTRIGNVSGHGTVIIHITLVEQLDHDAQTEGSRYTVPVSIAPRYGRNQQCTNKEAIPPAKTSIKVDIMMERGCQIRNVRSPSHPIQIDLGRTSQMPETDFEPCFASVNLRENLNITEDFVLTINANQEDLPFAMIETHPSLPNQRALMVSLIPKFSLRPDLSEIIFVIDRSGSMQDKIPTLRSALEVFLKSLPLGVPFNIISFGSSYSCLWRESRTYDQASLNEALNFSQTIDADMGGTEILGALHAALNNHRKGRLLEVLVLTDGQVWNQDHIFATVREASKGISARFFTLGVGNTASHSLINGISKAGNGFSQSVIEYEDLNKKVIRMLKGALTPRLRDCSLNLNLPSTGEDDFDHVSVTEVGDEPETRPNKPPISLFDKNVKELDITDLREPLPNLTIPNPIQAPTEIPSLFPFLRNTVYLLLSQNGTSIPQKITLRAMSPEGALELDIPVQDIGKGETIHQLAAKEAMVDLEEGRGWIHSGPNSEMIKAKHGSQLEGIVKKECERLGTEFQISGRHCSFVAVTPVEQAPAEFNSDTFCQVPSRQVPMCMSMFASIAPAHGIRSTRQPLARRVPTEPGFRSTQVDNAQGVSRTYPTSPSSTTLFGTPPTAPQFGHPSSAHSIPISPVLKLFYPTTTTTSNSFHSPGPVSGPSLFCGSIPGAKGPIRSPVVTPSSAFGSATPSSSPFSGFASSTSGACSGSSPVPATTGGLFGSPASITSSPLFGGGNPTSSSSPSIKTDPPNNLFGSSIGSLHSSGIFQHQQMRKRKVPYHSPRRNTPRVEEDKLQKLIRLQHFEGFWEWSPEVLKTLGIHENLLKARILSSGPPIDGMHALSLTNETWRNVLTTCLVKKHMETDFYESKDIWELLVDKANAWSTAWLNSLSEYDRLCAMRLMETAQSSFK